MGVDDVPDIYLVEFVLYHPLKGHTRPSARDVLKTDRSIHLSLKSAALLYQKMLGRIHGTPQMFNVELKLRRTTEAANFDEEADILAFYKREPTQDTESVDLKVPAEMWWQWYAPEQVVVSTKELEMVEVEG